MLAVRAGEGRTVALLAGLFASIEAARGAGEVAYVTLFLSRLGPTYLPYLYIALGGVSLVVALGYGVGLGKLPRRPFLVGLLLAFAGNAGGAPPDARERRSHRLRRHRRRDQRREHDHADAGLDDCRDRTRCSPGEAPLPAGHERGHRRRVRRDACRRSADRVDRPREPRAARCRVDRPWRGVRGADRHAGNADRLGRRHGRPATTSVLAQLRAGFDDVRRSPLLRLVAVAYVLFSILMFSVQFPYQTAIADAFGDDDAALATFVGLVQAAVTAISFVVSIVFANRIFARFGVVAAALILPVVYVLGLRDVARSPSRWRPPSRCRSASRSSSAASRTRPGAPCTRSSRASGDRRCWRSWTACPDSWE